MSCNVQRDYRRRSTSKNNKITVLAQGPYRTSDQLIYTSCSQLRARTDNCFHTNVDDDVRDVSLHEVTALRRA
eukprot:13463244-Heterocapsa_arctica.AAC.1